MSGSTESSDPSLTCRGHVAASDLLVHSGLPKKMTIVEVKHAEVTGEVAVGKKAVTYKGEIQVGKGSKGRSSES